MSNLKEALKAYISEERVVKMTEDMIRIESYYGIPNQETGVAKYIKSMFDASGIPCELKEVADGRCNVIATLDSGVPGKTMMFNGHLDTVEPNGWEEAFEPRIVDGIMYGRGTCDDKGPTAGLIEAMLALKESGELKKGKIVFTGVLDEEHNSIGTIDVIESGIQADAAIVAERSFFEIRNCQRGLEWLKFHFTGKTVHGGYLHDGINAISKANKYINAVEQKLAPKIFGRKHPTLNEAMVNIGIIHGGTQLSTVAGECDLYIDTRYLPYQKYEDVVGEFQELIDELAAEDPQFKCEMSVCEEAALKEGYVHAPFEIPEDHPLVTMLSDVIEDVTEKETVITYMKSWTDAGLLNEFANIPTVVLGPGGENPHADDESVPLEDLWNIALVYAMAAVEFCHS